MRVTAPAAFAAGDRPVGVKLAVKGARIEVSVDAEGETVLTTAESYDLAVALDAINTFFMDAYDDTDWYAMDVEWKFDDKYTPGTPTLWIKQARPFITITPPQMAALRVYEARQQG